MSPRDPDNPARWADGEKRSQNNAFDIAYTPSGRISMRREAESQKMSRRSSQLVAQQLANGRNLSVGALKHKTVAFDPPKDMKRKAAGT